MIWMVRGVVVSWWCGVGFEDLTYLINVWAADEFGLFLDDGEGNGWIGVWERIIATW